MNWKSILIIIALGLGTFACSGGGEKHDEGNEQKTEHMENQQEGENHEHMEGEHHEQNEGEASDTTASAGENAEGEAVAEASYQCPMKCEGDKIYHQPGKCPKCGMDLEPIKN